MARTSTLEKLFAKHGFSDFRWLDPQDIVVAEWVRMKCRFGCPDYGRAASCPPNTPSVEECARFFREYRRAAVFHFPKAVDKPEERFAWTRKVNLGLLELEKAVFKAGYPKAFLMLIDTCNVCLECGGVRTSCKQPRLGRPTPEGLAVDVFGTVHKIGYPIEVLSKYDQTMNRYSFLMIE